MTHTAPNRTPAVLAARAAAQDVVHSLLGYYAPKVPESRGRDVLLAWLQAAADLIPAPATLDDVTRAAWRQEIPPAALANRFRAAGLLPPGHYQDAVRFAVLGHALGAGLTIKEFADGDVRPWYRLCRSVARPYYDSARMAIETARRLGSTWATERWLVPLLIDIPADAWVRPLLLSRQPREKAR